MTARIRAAEIVAGLADRAVRRLAPDLYPDEAWRLTRPERQILARLEQDLDPDRTP